MKALLSAAAAAAVILAAGSAQAATVVNFDELAHDGPVKLHRTNPIASGGLSFRTSDLAQGFASWGRNALANPDPGGAALLNWSGGATVTVSRVGGGLFNIGSIDLADVYNATNGIPALTTVRFAFFDGARTRTETIALDLVKGMETFAFNQNVEWFSFTALGNGSVQFDNVTWGEPVSSAVPEPATWAMLITGFAGAGSMLRRSRRRVALA